LRRPSSFFYGPVGEFATNGGRIRKAAELDPAIGAVEIARMIKKHGPITTNLIELIEEAQKVSTDTAPAG
jgi:hypothetical protein